MDAGALLQRSFDDLGTPLRDVTFCVLDIETTGSDRIHDVITEIGVTKVRGGEQLGTFQTLVDPGRAIPAYITILTGITESMVARAPRFHQIAATLQEFVGDAVIVGHNVGFDLAFLNAALQRTGRAPFANTVVDTLPLARRLIRDEVPDCRLGTLATRLRLAHRPTHRALDDALATADLLHLLIERAAGWGVLGLDDLVDLPTRAGHPQAAKLRFTERLPRTSGVYRFHDANGDVLYVGKATNLRARVRSYFSGDDRRKIGGLLRETRRISHHPTPHPLVAEVLEIRTIQSLRPRYNSALTHCHKYRYVQLDPTDHWARLSVVAEPRAGCVTLGPVSSAAQARLIAEAIEDVIPLRRCSGRLAARPAGAPCASAQLGRPCPCTGQVEPTAYTLLVHQAAAALSHSPHRVVESLRERLITLSAQRRFEEAAHVRDRAEAFVAAHQRITLARALVSAGGVELAIGDTEVHLDHGVITAVGHGGQLPLPLPIAAPDPPEPHLPLPTTCIDEVLAIGRFLQRHASSVHIHRAGGTWAVPTSPVAGLVRLPRADLYDAA